MDAMRKVSTDRIEPGYIAAADVAGPLGNVFLGKGSPVTPALGRRLRNWGITHVYVEGEDDPGKSVKAKAPSPIDVKGDLYDIFVDTLDNPRMRKVFNAVCEHKIRKRGGA
jgi:hypothetical protein